MSGSQVRAEAQRVARESFGYDGLRPVQLEAVTSVVEGRDVLAVLPTGSGKSAIYQIAGMLLPGVTVVVSPLLALQRDQMEGLEEAPDAPEAVAINSSQSDGANEDAWDALASGRAEYVLLSPEQLGKDDVLERLRALTVSLVAVDEAHCVSSWGHDFRPDYLQLGSAVERIGRPTVVALTATGSPPVRDEIVARLGLRTPRVLATGFDRPNITLGVWRHATDHDKVDEVLRQARELPGPGLMYVATRRGAEEMAASLAADGRRAMAYHAGLPAAERRAVHDRFRDDELDVVVATTAFGMGIDKPNVRFVLHSDIPDSIESYYQEIGRAGRDGEAAVAVLHYRSEDLGLRTFFAAQKADVSRLSRVFAALLEFEGDPKPGQLAAALEITTRRLTGLVNQLETGRALRRVQGRIVPDRSLTAQEAAERAAAAVEERERIDQSRIAMMRSYAEADQCRRGVLLAYFGEDLPGRCENCDWCREHPGVEEAQVPADHPFPPQSAVVHSEWGDGVVMSVEEDRITVFFEQQGYKVLALSAIEENDLLRRV